MVVGRAIEDEFFYIEEKMKHREFGKHTILSNTFANFSPAFTQNDPDRTEKDVNSYLNTWGKNIISIF